MRRLEINCLREHREAVLVHILWWWCSSISTSMPEVPARRIGSAPYPPTTSVRGARVSPSSSFESSSRDAFSRHNRQSVSHRRLAATASGATVISVREANRAARIIRSGSSSKEVLRTSGGSQQSCPQIRHTHRADQRSRRPATRDRHGVDREVTVNEVLSECPRNHDRFRDSTS